MDYTEFASSIQGLSALETGISEPLHQFSNTLSAYADAMHTMVGLDAEIRLDGSDNDIYAIEPP